MHPILNHQLEMAGFTDKALNQRAMQKFIVSVDKAYQDADEDRARLDTILKNTSQEMQGLDESNTEDELKSSEAKYRRLVENIQQHYFFYAYGTDGVFTYLSDSLTDMLGYTQEEFLTHYTEYLTDNPKNDKARQSSEKSIAGEQQDPYELSIFHKDGTICHLEFTERPLFNAQGKVIAVEGIAKNITSHYEAQEEMSNIAWHDSLTALPNRLNLYNQMEQLIVTSNLHDRQFAMLFLDLDHFKNINDTLGHDVGDKLLQEVVKRISPNIRKEDIFARIGGDEFIVVLNDISKINLAASMNRIMELFQEEWQIGRHRLNISSSIGISIFPRDGDNTTDLMKNADIAMYKAKKLGRNNFSFFTPELDKKMLVDLQLEEDMANALENDQFVLHYQPTRVLKTDALLGAEALVRWQHPREGLILPDRFITLAENTGLILKLGEWIMRETCETIARFNAISEQKLFVSVNISTRQLQHGDLYQIIKEAIESSGIEPQQLSIEITENIMIENIDIVIAVLDQIKSLGVQVAMDDFGIGYSSLSYLHLLPIDLLKIDKLHIDTISKDVTKVLLLDTILIMAESLGLKVVAEGVDREFQRAYLKDRGCSYYQGYLSSEPIPESEFIKYLS